MSSNILRKIIAPIIATIVLTLSIAWMAGLFTEKIDPHEVTGSANTVKSNYKVKGTLVPKYESAPASLTARETTLISSRILARIENIHVRAGDIVNKGDLLISLENSELTSQLAQAKSKIVSLQGDMKEAQNALKRVENLKQQGLASNADLDQAQAIFTRLQGEIQTAKQGQKVAETSLGYSRILAPFSGRIVDRSAEPGNMASPGQPILALFNPSSLLIESNVRELVALKLELGQKLSVNIDSLGLQSIATISELVPAADPNAHSFVVKADIPFNEDQRPGMFARLFIPIGEERIILIPAEYVRNYGQLHRVWVNNQGNISRRFIRVGESYDGKVEVISGLAMGDIITEFAE
ncbi:efflux RND transporter periplasmic adaptor subunit [Paraglaciecola sp.]|uniref:efflux RND transporter periplasmic adaptor subunit n=1 Tax=Paraglaciecola sp. TaxID=1920173 RepID=UPI003263BB3B